MVLNYWGDADLDFRRRGLSGLSSFAVDQTPKEFRQQTPIFIPNNA